MDWLTVPYPSGQAELLGAAISALGIGANAVAGQQVDLAVLGSQAQAGWVGDAEQAFGGRVSGLTVGLGTVASVHQGAAQALTEYLEALTAAQSTSTWALDAVTSAAGEFRVRATSIARDLADVIEDSLSFLDDLGLVKAAVGWLRSWQPPGWLSFQMEDVPGPVEVPSSGGILGDLAAPGVGLSDLIAGLPLGVRSLGSDARSWAAGVENDLASAVRAALTSVNQAMEDLSYAGSTSARQIFSLAQHLAGWISSEHTRLPGPVMTMIHDVESLSPQDIAPFLPYAKLGKAVEYVQFADTAFHLTQDLYDVATMQGEDRRDHIFDAYYVVSDAVSGQLLGNLATDLAAKSGAEGLLAGLDAIIVKHDVEAARLVDWSELYHDWWQLPEQLFHPGVAGQVWDAEKSGLGSLLVDVAEQSGLTNLVKTQFHAPLMSAIMPPGLAEVPGMAPAFELGETDLTKMIDAATPVHWVHSVTDAWLEPATFLSGVGRSL